MFGMRPLVKDIEALLEAVLFKRPSIPRFTARAAISDTAERIIPERKFSRMWDQPMSGVFTGNGEASVHVRAGCLYTYNLEGIDAARAKFGIRLSDTPISAWQLIPMSFLVDWVLNISDIIKALTPVAGVVRLAEWYSVKVVVREARRISTMVPAADPTWTGSGGGDQLIYTVETKDRVPCVLGEHVRLHSNIKWDFTKTLLSVALLTQTLTGLAVFKDLKDLAGNRIRI